MGNPVHDIVLPYNSCDQAAVEQIALQLRQAGLIFLLAPRDLPAGGEWQDGIDHGLHRDWSRAR